MTYTKYQGDIKNSCWIFFHGEYFITAENQSRRFGIMSGSPKMSLYWCLCGRDKTNKIAYINK